MTRIVIVSGIQLATNPRAVKEADALASAGYDVTVLCAALDPGLVTRDSVLCAGRRWKLVNVLDSADDTLAGSALWLRARMRLRFWREMGKRFGVATATQLGYAAPELLSWCMSNPAELYILHHPQSMWVGVKLIRAGKKVAADFEDWYSRDVPADSGSARSLEKLREWERVVLENAAYATTASQALSDALAAEYACDPPAVVYNAFPLSERNSIDGQKLDRKDASLPSLIWFSQVIGPERGLETLMDSLNEVGVDFEIHLRGRVDPAFAGSLVSRAPAKWRSRIFLQEQVPHAELLSRVAEHDAGYAGEIPYCANKDLTVANKILHYILAGLPVIASDTEGHREVSRESPEAVSLFTAGNPQSLAAALNSVMSDEALRWRARADALASAERIWSWEKFAPVLVRQVASRFPVRGPARR
jgi:glycosyltransferase involved in cell wall biosynthesis